MRRLLTVIIALVVVGCGSKPLPPVKKKETVIVKRGEKVSFGWFYCQIDSVFATEKLGGKHTFTEAKGIYLVVDLTIGNQGMGPETVETNLFELIAVSGSDTLAYKPDFYAAAYEGDRAFGEREILKVGKPRRGYIIFDVPKEITNAWLRLGPAYFFLR